MTQPLPTLITGGTGKTGRRVAARLVAGDLPVRIGSRAVIPPFDWADDRTWAPALDGVEAVYVTFAPDVGVPGADEAVGTVAELAVAAGARRLVLLSGRGEDGARRAEDRVRSSGADWTIVRSAVFNQNFDEGFFRESLVGGELHLHAGDVAEPFIDAEDIADVVVAALTDDRHIGEVYDVTGPRLLTFADAVAEISAAAGRPMRYVPISPEAFLADMRADGMPDADAFGYTELFRDIFDGRNAVLGDGVQRALGRASRDFSAYVHAAAATGVWTTAQVA